MIPRECYVKRPITDISEAEEETALRAMKANKAPGPSGASNDLLKFADRTGII